MTQMRKCKNYNTPLEYTHMLNPASPGFKVMYVLGINGTLGSIYGTNIIPV